MGHHPGSCAGVGPGADGDQQPREHPDREGPARRGRCSWRSNGIISAPLSVMPLVPDLLEIRGTLRLARGELESGAEDLLAVGEDLEAMRMLNPAGIQWRQEVAPALGVLDRTDEARRIVTEGERRAWRGVPGRSCDRRHAARKGLDRTEADARSRPCASRSRRWRPAARPPHELAHSHLELGGRAASRRAAQRIARAASPGRSSSPTRPAPMGSPAEPVKSWPQPARGLGASSAPA